MITTIGKNIKYFRIARGLKQEELCTGICSVGQMSKIENGKVNVKEEELSVLASRLGVTIDELRSMNPQLENLEQTMKKMRILRSMGQYEQSIALAEYVIQESQACGLEDLYLEAVYESSRIYEYRGDWDQVISITSKILSSGLAKEPARLVEYWGQLGMAYSNSGFIGNGFRFYAQQSKYIDMVPADHPNALRLFFTYAVNQYRMRQYRETYRYAMKTLELANAEKKHVWRLLITNVLTMSLHHMDMERQYCYELLLSSLHESEQNVMLYEAGMLANNLGSMYMKAGENAKSRRYQELCIQYWECVSDSYTDPMICEPYYELSLLAVDEGLLDQAERYLTKMEIVLRNKSGGYVYRAHIPTIRAKIATLQNRPDEHIKYLREALSIYEEHQIYRDAAATADDLAQALEGEGLIDDALELYRKSVKLYQLFDEVTSS